MINKHISAERFTLIDVETANSDPSSICQIGIVTFEHNVEVDSWSTLVNPNDRFSNFNIGIHGITAQMVKRQPTFPKIYKELRGILEGELVFSHTLFDRGAVHGAIEQHGLKLFNHNWVDSTRIIRRACPQYAQRGYNLKNLTKDFKISFAHHDALEDARAAAQVLVLAMQSSNIGLSDWLIRIDKKRTASNSAKKIKKVEGSALGYLSGEVVVITGDPSAGKQSAAEAINSLGASVHPNITKKTTMLIVCGASIDSITGKQKKAEEYAQNGQKLRIMTEDKFISMLRNADL